MPTSPCNLRSIVFITYLLTHFIRHTQYQSTTSKTFINFHTVLVSAYVSIAGTWYLIATVRKTCRQQCANELALCSETDCSKSFSFHTYHVLLLLYSFIWIVIFPSPSPFSRRTKLVSLCKQERPLQFDTFPLTTPNRTN